MREKTTVAIVGAGPAGLFLGNVLIQSGIDCVILEQHDREYVERRARAGLIEYRTVDLLGRFVLADRLLAEGARHVGCEFRTGGRRFSVPYGRLAGDVAHHVYPQQFLVRDMIKTFLAAGGDLRFEADVTEIALDEPRVTGKTPAGHMEIACDLVAGCDGYYGPARAAMPDGAVREHHREYAYRWLTLLAAAPPSTREIIYAAHEEGFAGHMLRTPTISRFYLQGRPGDELDDWPDERIWAELRKRLAVGDGWTLNEGEVTEKTMMAMRVFVADRMQYGPLFLAGDAAHVITPAGGKGMNLAIGDAYELARGIMARYHGGDGGERLASYTDRCLPRVWRAQEFSDWLLHVINRPATEDSFEARMRSARLEALRTSTAAAKWFAENYVGLPLYR